MYEVVLRGMMRQTKNSDNTTKKLSNRPALTVQTHVHLLFNSCYKTMIIGTIFRRPRNANYRGSTVILPPSSGSLSSELSFLPCPLCNWGLPLFSPLFQIGLVHNGIPEWPSPIRDWTRFQIGLRHIYVSNFSSECPVMICMIQ